MKNDRSWTEINLSSFKNNLRELKKFFPNQEFMQIVKADAYGHGAFQIARKALEFGAVSLGVANVQEGILLRHQGIKKPIVILSPILISEIDLVLQNELIPTVSSLKIAREIAKRGKSKIHINIDTGMGRSGIKHQDALENIKEIHAFDNLEIEGIFSHFAAAESNIKFTQAQSQKFKDIITKLDFQPKYVHISNSSGVVKFPTKYANLVRIGLLSFGIYSDKEIKKKIILKPVMTFKSLITQLKSAEMGNSIGYNRTYSAPRKMKYAILPIGYADGYDFLLSNKGKVLLHNTICDVIGKVSMDMIAIDISNLKEVKIGDEVVLLGNSETEITAEFLTSLYNGLSYELVSQIGRRAKRYYFDKGKLIDSSPLLRRSFVPMDHPDAKLNQIIETAIEQRLQSKEIASLVQENILQRLFTEKDQDIQYRSNFKHHIKFEDSNEFPEYFLATTTLTFTKKLMNNYFIVACASSEKELEKYLLKPDVEYRWLLHPTIDLSNMYFEVTRVKINNLELYNETVIAANSIEVRCHHPELPELTGKEVKYSISTKTYYPKNSHQLAVYIIEMTQGVDISFESDLENVEAVPIFSGKSKFPKIIKNKNKISISTNKDEWVFPTSGVVFVY